jgi:hypothetical protein
MELVEDEDDMLPWHVDDHCHDELTLLEYDRALAGNDLKLACRMKEKGSNLQYDLYIFSLHFLHYEHLASSAFATDLFREKDLQLLVCIFFG